MLIEKFDLSTPIIIPNWTNHKQIGAFFTTRDGDPKAHSTIGDFLKNSPDLKKIIAPRWLEQTHSASAHRLTKSSKGLHGDALWTAERGLPCAIKVADCVPILLRDSKGTEVSAIHAGWKGLLAGIIENSVGIFHSHPSNIEAWIGPSISVSAYPVGLEILEKFCSKNTIHAQHFHLYEKTLHFDIREAVKNTLFRTGITNISETVRCVYSEKSSFYSVRREKTDKRMAAVIWLNSKTLKKNISYTVLLEK